MTGYFLVIGLVLAVVAGCRTPGAAVQTSGVGPRSFTFVDANRHGRTIVTEVYFPATATGADASPAAGGPFPIVVFSHGLRGLPADYKGLWSAWVQAGFAVVAPVYPMTSRGAAEIVPTDLINQPADASFALTEVLKQNGNLRGALDAARVAAVGHSEGALTTYGLFTSCCRDARLKAGIILAGDAVGFERDAPNGPAAPILFIHGDADPLVPIALGRAAYARVPWAKAFVTLHGAAHIPPYIGGSDPSAKLVATVTTDFLRWTLLADPTARAAVLRDASLAGVATIDDHL